MTDVETLAALAREIDTTCRLTGTFVRPRPAHRAALRLRPQERQGVRDVQAPL
ncbi:hypothetical protein [Micromonospora sp. NPDC005710]|uniref:hypothetical protein n=1 Tax=Micromonospora sp. NPDC005710 TaxID=3157051 RepID=UPI00340F5258